MGVNKSVLMLCIASPILSYVLDTHRYQILHYSKSFISFLVRPCPDSFQPENSRAELFLLITAKLRSTHGRVLFKMFWQHTFT
jgi:hypothetical protein